MSLKLCDVEFPVSGFDAEIIYETQEHEVGSLSETVAFDEWRDEFIEAHYSDISMY